MAIVESLEGTLDDLISFHVDLASDILYLRRIDRPEAIPVGEDGPDDVILFRDEDSREIVGLSVIDWWLRFGEGTPPRLDPRDHAPDGADGPKTQDGSGPRYDPISPPRPDPCTTRPPTSPASRSSMSRPS